MHATLAPKPLDRPVAGTERSPTKTPQAVVAIQVNNALSLADDPFYNSLEFLQELY